MRLPAQRRDLVVWSPSVGPAARDSAPRDSAPRRTHRFIRTGALLTVIGLLRLARAARPRWRPLLAGAVLTVVGAMLTGAWGALAFPGLLLLLSALLVPASPDADRMRRSELESELAAVQASAAVRASIPFWSCGGSCAVPWEPSQRD